MGKLCPFFDFPGLGKAGPKACGASKSFPRAPKPENEGFQSCLHPPYNLYSDLGVFLQLVRGVVSGTRNLTTTCFYKLDLEPSYAPEALNLKL